MTKKKTISKTETKARVYEQRKVNIEALKTLIKESEYIEVIDQRAICEKMNLPYLVSLFRIEYRQRFLSFFKENITSVATASKETGIPHKYLCEVKAYYEKKKLIKIVMYGKCPTTGANKVQYLSADPKVWKDSSLLPKSNQLELF